MIRSRSNPLVKQARSLRERKSREETGLFVVEGIHHVGEVIAAGWEPEAVLVAPESLRTEFATSLLASYQGRQEQVSTDVMEYISSKENPSGIVAIVRQRPSDLQSIEKMDRGVALVAPQDPGNLGTIMRTMDALDCDALFLLEGGADPYHPTAIRASMGAVFWKPVVRGRFAEFVAWQRQRGIGLIGSSAHGGQDYLRWKPTSPWILLLGSEQKGLTAHQRGACDILLSLPMRGRATSLNLAVAAGVLLYHLTSPQGAGPAAS